VSEPLSVFSPATDLLARLSAGELGAEECLDMHLERYSLLNDSLNAVVRTDVASARATARRLDRMARAGERAGPLHGLPVTIKDTFDVDGLPASAGAPEYALRPPRSGEADVVTRLRRAGAVIWGKTNTPYLAGDNQTDNPVFGRTANPWDPERTPGGSSGGAAAALASGMTPLEIGSDMGGSLRTPAHFCGVCALKPSFGVLPLLGHVPPAPGSLTVRDMNVAGPMARNVGDLDLLFRILCGLAPPSPAAGSLSGRRIGVWSAESGFILSASCRSAVEQAAEAAEEAGAEVRTSRPPLSGEELMELYLSMLLPALAADLPDRLIRAMRLGRPIARALHGGERFSRSKWALYSAASHAEWIRSNERRAAVKLEMLRYFSRFDALIAPVAPSEAFRHVASGDAVSRRLTVDGKPVPFHAFHAWTALASLLHLPAVVIPVPRADGALPAGVQIIAAEGADLACLEIAGLIERQLSGGGFRRPPEPHLRHVPPSTDARPKRRQGRPSPTRSRHSAR